MRKFYFLLTALLLQITSVFAQIRETNSILFFSDEGVIAHYRMYISFLKSQEKDSILNYSAYHYETRTKKVSLIHPYKVDIVDACGYTFVKIYPRSKTLDSLMTVLIQDKCTASIGCKYLTEMKTIFCEATTAWERARRYPNGHCADPDCCRVMCLVEIPEATINVRRDVLLTRNDEGKYVNNSELIHN